MKEKETGVIEESKVKDKLKELEKSRFLAQQQIIGMRNKLAEMEVNLERINGAIEITNELLKDEEDIKDESGNVKTRRKNKKSN